MQSELRMHLCNERRKVDFQREIRTFQTSALLVLVSVLVQWDFNNM